MQLQDTRQLTQLGWALTLLSKENLAYASTAQTVGLTAGQFLSYTVFLAFNSKDFANKWFRGANAQSETGLLELDSYLTFWGWAYLVVTLGLALMKREDRDRNTDGIKEVYKSMWGILKLKNIQSFIIIHLIAKIGFQANDAVTSLKLLDKGLKQEQLSLVILVDFPVEVFLGYYVGKWCQTYPAMRIWCYSFVGRLIAAGFAQFVVSIFPADGATGGFLLVVIAEHVLSTFMNTVMFVAVSAFHAKISDPVIGGTYMTLLATYVSKLVLTCHPLTEDQCIQSRRHIPPLLRPQSGRHVHGRYLHSALDATQDRPPQRPTRYTGVLVRSRGRKAPLHQRRWRVQCYHRWVLHCECTLYHHRGDYILGIHQAGGHEDSGVAVEGLEDSAVECVG